MAGDKPDVLATNDGFKPGVRARVVGLKNELDQRVAILYRYVPGDDRWQVTMDDGTGRQLSLHTNNLEIVPQHSRYDGNPTVLQSLAHDCSQGLQARKPSNFDFAQDMWKATSVAS